MHFSISFTTFSIAVTVIFIAGNALAEETIDETKTVCEALDLNEQDLTIRNITDTMSYEDVLRLTIWNLKYGLKSGIQLDLPKGKWKRGIVNTIFKIFEKACPNAYVPNEFMNIIREMNMIYYNSFPDSNEELSLHWNKTLKVLTDCQEKIEMLKVEGPGLMIDTVVLNGEAVHLLPPKELADSIPAVDLIIDNLWWTFSLSFGLCYSPAGYRSSWAPRYKKLFYEDFIHPLIERWGHVGRETNFGVIFGNFDLSQILNNIRLCVTAAYTVLGIADRQLVRPISLGNQKTGESFVKK